MTELLENLRFRFPRTFGVTVLLTICGIGLAAFMNIPSTPLSDALGVTSMQVRLASLYRAGFWYYRAQFNNHSFAPVEKTTYGNILGVDRTGQLVVKQAVGSTFERASANLADVHLTDIPCAAEAAKEFRPKDATFEFYPGDQVVAWVKEMPLNVHLIEQGCAEPDPNPPTNIVDKAFAIYYWRNFYGN